MTPNSTALLMMNMTVCPTCGSGKIKKVQRKWIRMFQDKTYSVPRLEFHECPVCGEKVYDRDAMRKIEAHSPAFARAAPPSLRGI
jgi:YgiT-type zinc finger domain-containing protein